MRKPHPLERGHILLIREAGWGSRIGKRAPQRAGRHIVLMRDEHHGLSWRQQDAPAPPRPKTCDRTKEAGLPPSPPSDDQNPLTRMNYDMVLLNFVQRSGEATLI